MSRPGPKPKPSAIRKFENNPGNLPLNEHEPLPESLPTLEAPDWLGSECEYMQLEKFPVQKVAQMIWDEFAPQLDRLGVLTSVDKDKFSRYCDTFARWLKAKSFLDRHGETYPVYGTLYDQEQQPDGTTRTVCKKVLKQMRSFPQVALYVKFADQLKRYEEEFGIGAASRTRIQTIVPAPFGDKTPDDDHNFNYAGKLKAVK